MRNTGNCADFQNRIALHVEGDLSASELGQVEAHLAGCVACGELADELRKSQSVLKSIGAGLVDAADLSQVRERVLNEVGDLEPAPAWSLWMHRLIFAGLRRKAAIAGVLVMALASGAVWYEQTRGIVTRSETQAKTPNAEPVEIANLDVSAAVVSPSVARPSAVVPRFVHRVEPSIVPESDRVEISAVVPAEQPMPQESQVSQIPMKFLTDDPNIIIYWLPSDKGD